MTLKNVVVFLLIILMFSFSMSLKAQKNNVPLRSGKNEIQAGIYLIQASVSTQLPYSVEVLAASRLHEPYQHAKCGGYVREEKMLSNDGTIDLYCLKCNKKWDMKIGVPRN